MATKIDERTGRWMGRRRSPRTGKGRLETAKRALRATLILLAYCAFAQTAAAQNVVLIIIDDIGVEKIGAYGENPNVGPTPNIDSLAAQGVLFRNAWALPVCSPFRSSVMTGLHPIRHGVGHAIAPNDPARQIGLDADQQTLAKLLSAAGYRTAALGKWHMGGWYPDDVPHPTYVHHTLVGFDYYEGFYWGGVDHYYWPKVENDASAAYTTKYATTDTVDDAIAQLSGTEPFFLWVAPLGGHGPIHEPPAELHSFDLEGVPISGNVPLYQKAMIEALDTEIGRLLAAIDFWDTTVILVGDNGSPGNTMEPPYTADHAKRSVYEGGVNVPLIIAGEAVAASRAGQESAAFVQAPDLFATILEIANVPGSAVDSFSFAPHLQSETAPSRSWVYTEIFVPHPGPPDPEQHKRSVREARYKLVRNGLAPDELYDLWTDPFEQSPLDLSILTVDEEAAYSAMDTALLSVPEPGIEAVPFGLLALALLARRRRTSTGVR